jgi:hypothetical protein
MNAVTFAVIVATLLGIPFHALAQESTKPPLPNVTETPARSADPSTGNWQGTWQINGKPWISGSMEMDVDVTGDQVTGRVRSRCTPDDPLEWAKLTGVRRGEKVFAQYDRGGRCGKVDVNYSIDREERVMTGTFSNEYPAHGTLRLTR